MTKDDRACLEEMGYLMYAPRPERWSRTVDGKYDLRVRDTTPYEREVYKERLAGKARLVDGSGAGFEPFYGDSVAELDALMVADVAKHGGEE